MRTGTGVGTAVTAQIGPDTAVFVPRGAGNASQTLQPATAYTHLVNVHWSAHTTYTLLNLADSTLAIDWPIRRAPDIEPLPRR